MSRYTVKPLPNSDVVQSCKGPCTACATWNDGISEVARICGGDRQCLGDSQVFGTKEGRDEREVWLLGERRRSSEGLAARRVGSERRRACRAHGEHHVVEVCSRAQSLKNHQTSLPFVRSSRCRHKTTEVQWSRDSFQARPSPRPSTFALCSLVCSIHPSNSTNNVFSFRIPLIPTSILSN